MQPGNWNVWWLLGSILSVFAGTLQTDHRTLENLLTSQTGLNPKLNCGVCSYSNFMMTTIYHPGKTNSGPLLST